MVNEGSVGFDGSWLGSQEPRRAPKRADVVVGRYLRARSAAAVSQNGNIEEELRYPGPPQAQ